MLGSPYYDASKPGSSKQLACFAVDVECAAVGDSEPAQRLRGLSRLSVAAAAASGAAWHAYKLGVFADGFPVVPEG